LSNQQHQNITYYNANTNNVIAANYYRCSNATDETDAVLHSSGEVLQRMLYDPQLTIDNVVAITPWSIKNVILLFFK